MPKGKKKKDPTNPVNDLKDVEKKPTWSMPEWQKPPSWSHRSIWD